MSIFSKNNRLLKKAIQGRKADHFEICVDKKRYAVENQQHAGFDDLRFVHEALPEISWDSIDSQLDFLGYRISFPFFVSCMTGGFSGGQRLNQLFAKAANQAVVPIGLGSIRVLFRHPESFKDFHIKPFAPDVPVLANLGAVQLRDMDHSTIIEMVRRLEVQALVVHLNPGQEIAQPDGDRDFRGLCDAIARFIDAAPFPVIVKETGFGIRPQRVCQLLAMGASYVDLAGAGGTNWMSVDAARLSEDNAQFTYSFTDWGMPTALLLGAVGYSEGRVLASGGLRSGLDIAKSVALGAYLGGIALPLARVAAHGGEEAVLQSIERYKKEFQTVMLLTGSADIATLRKAALLKDPSFEANVTSLQKMEN